MGTAQSHPFFIPAHEDLALRAYEFAVGGDEMMRGLPIQAPERFTTHPVMAMILKARAHIGWAIDGYLDLTRALALPERMRPGHVAYEPLNTVMAALHFANQWDRVITGHMSKLAQNAREPFQALLEKVHKETTAIFASLEEQLMIDVLAYATGFARLNRLAHAPTRGRVEADIR